MHAVPVKQGPHALDGQFRLFDQTGLVGKPEQLHQVRQGAGALLPADHDEVVLVAIDPGHEHHAGLVETGRRLEDVPRQRNRGGQDFVKPCGVARCERKQGRTRGGCDGAGVARRTSVGNSPIS